MKKIQACASGSCSRVTMACLVAAMQHTAEHQSRPPRRSRLPMHWIHATLRGTSPSEGRWTRPPVGPEALRSRSYSRPVTTLACRP